MKMCRFTLKVKFKAKTVEVSVKFDLEIWTWPRRSTYAFPLGKWGASYTTGGSALFGLIKGLP